MAGWRGKQGIVVATAIKNRKQHNHTTYDMWSHNQAWENSVGEVTCSLPDERGGDKQVNVSPNVVSLNT